MEKTPLKFGFYAILTEPVKGYEYLAKLLVDHGVTFIQLRMKRESAPVIRATAETIRKITQGSKSRFIVNDDPHMARDVGADGVHLGQGDMSYAKAREIVGPEAIIGISTHSPEQTRIVCMMEPDYIGVGPVYPTPTKVIPDPAIGIDGMREMLSQATVPAVAIGGIDLKNLPEVLAAGAQNFSMVRQLMQAEEPEKVLEEIRNIEAGKK